MFQWFLKLCYIPKTMKITTHSVGFSVAIYWKKGPLFTFPEPVTERDYRSSLRWVRTSTGAQRLPHLQLPPLTERSEWRKYIIVCQWNDRPHKWSTSPSDAEEWYCLSYTANSYWTNNITYLGFPLVSPSVELFKSYSTLEVIYELITEPRHVSRHFKQAVTSVYGHINHVYDAVHPIRDVR